MRARRSCWDRLRHPVVDRPILRSFPRGAEYRGDPTVPEEVEAAIAKAAKGGKAYVNAGRLEDDVIRALLRRGFGVELRGVPWEYTNISW